DLLATPKMPFLQQHVRDSSALGINHQPVDVSDWTVRRVDGVAATDVDLALGDSVVRHGLRYAGHRCPADGTSLPAVQTVVGPGQDLLRAVALVTDGAGDELGVLSRIESVELGDGAMQADSIGGRLG